MVQAVTTLPPRERGKLQGGLLGSSVHRQSSCSCSGIFVAPFHVWTGRAGSGSSWCFADFPGVTLNRAGVRAEGEGEQSCVMSLPGHRQAQPCWGSLCSPAPRSAASLGSALAARRGLCSGGVQSESPKPKTSQHWSEAAALQLALTYLCGELILLIAL